MRKALANTFLCLATVVATTAVVTVIASRLLWGHWFSPPSSDGIASRFETVERFTTFGWTEAAGSGPDALQEAAGEENWTSGEWPGGRFPAALGRRELVPSSTIAVPAKRLDDVVSLLDSSDLLLDGDPYYTDAKHLRGHVVLGHDSTGAPLLGAALMGGQVSNDHYPYYEALMSIGPSSELTLESHQQYFFDVAGLEGVAHWMVGIAVGTLVLCGWLLFWGGLGAVRLIQRTRRSEVEP